jgi:hypothetical protein
MTLEGLKALYPDELPKRGEIKVEFSQNLEDGVAGVIGNVIMNITGATTTSGFKGIMGLFSRTNLMFFESNISSSVKFTRTDTNTSVDVIYDPSSILPREEMRVLMQKCISKQATETEEKVFGELWQLRVKEISQNINQVIQVK